MRVVKGVVNVPPLLAVADKPARTEQAKIVGARRLRKASDRGQITDAQLARLEQCGDQTDSPGVRENAERLSQALEDLIARQPIQNRLHALRLDTFDSTAIKRRDFGLPGYL